MPTLMFAATIYHLDTRASRLAAAAFFLAVLCAGPVHAEHEVDHRYTVEGYVLDARKIPQSDVIVTVTTREGLVGRAVTDRRGYYRVQLHLHDPDLGRELTVKAGDRQARIRVTFDPADKHTARVHDLNFVGAETSEKNLGTRGFPTWAYILIGAMILLLVARSISRALKQRRKMQARQEHPAKKKRKKKRSKRRR